MPDPFDFSTSIRHTDATAHASSLGREYEPVGIGPADTLHRGNIDAIRLRGGAILNLVDIIDIRDYTSSMTVQPGFAVLLCLTGSIKVSAGGVTTEIGAIPTSGGETAQGIFSRFTRTERISRTTGGRGLRCVEILLPPDWFENAGLDGLAHDLLHTHLMHERWPLTPRQIRLAEQMLRPPQCADALRDLYLESHAGEALAEMLRILCDVPRTERKPLLKLRDRQRMGVVKALLDTDEGKKLPLPRIAALHGTNVNALQRQFQSAFGVTVFQYIREQRLASAREALEEAGVSVAQAAHIAGYASPASFATAFRNRFGRPPKEMRGNT
ncbi:MAG: helix-turn-helix transcriptional regulator [Rhizobiales bacterium]|nr:helix-turn-helix transcriptional regulator [Hyphomicrobiales bacterium]